MPAIAGKVVKKKQPVTAEQTHVWRSFAQIWLTHQGSHALRMHGYDSTGKNEMKLWPLFLTSMVLRYKGNYNLQ